MACAGWSISKPVRTKAATWRILASEALRYQAQLRRYAHLARELGPEPVRAGLYFPLLAAWREVDVSQ